jgi:hypothetical protein
MPVKTKKTQWPLNTAEKALRALSSEALMKRIHEENDHLVNHVKQIRIYGKIGKYAQDGMEEQTAKKYRCTKLEGLWVQMYLGENGFEIPKPIKKALTSLNS